MNKTDYIELINKTAVYPREVKNFGRAYTFLGFLGELNEFEETFLLFMEGQATQEDVLKELGDVEWYRTALSLEYEIIVPDMDPVRAPNIPNLIRATKEFGLGCCEKVKKHFRDGKNINEDLFLLIQMFNDLLYYVCDYMSCTIEDIRTMNAEKLIRRREEGTLHGDGSNR